MRPITAVIIMVLATFVARLPAQSSVVNIESDIGGGWVLHPAFDGANLYGYLAQQVTGTVAPGGYSILAPAAKRRCVHHGGIYRLRPRRGG